MMKDIVIKFIRQDEQRYNTVGDYWEDENTIQFRVSKFEDWKAEFLIALHELVEKAINMRQGIADKQVDDWDFNCKEDDPGIVDGCPYSDGHAFATAIEMLMCNKLGMNWQNYDAILDKVEDKKE